MARKIGNLAEKYFRTMYIPNLELRLDFSELRARLQVRMRRITEPLIHLYHLPLEHPARVRIIANVHAAMPSVRLFYDRVEAIRVLRTTGDDRYEEELRRAIADYPAEV